ncbi:unnamed protein product [Prunus armeniaca]
MFVDAMVNGKTTCCLVDTGVSHNFISVQEAKRLGCRVSEEAGSMKMVNSTAKPIDGVARGVALHIAAWKEVADFFLIPMDDYNVMLGMEFMDEGGAMSCMVPVMDKVEKEVKPVPKAVEAVLKEFANVIPNELAKTLPPRREVGHAFEKLKRAPMEEPVLRLPDLSKHFKDGPPLAFESWKLNDTEQRIREGLLHEPQAKSLLELVKDGRTRRFWLDDGALYATGKKIYVPIWDNLRHYGSANQRDWAKL